MPNLLLDLDIDRVDLCSEGANSAAHIKLYKRKENAEMNFEEVLAKLKPEHAEVITKAFDDAKAELDSVNDLLAKEKADKETAEKEKEEMKDELEKSKEPPAQTEEDVIKNLDPETQEIFKTMKAKAEAAETLAKQMQQEKVQEEAVAKAKELNALPVEQDKLVELVKNMDQEVIEVLKAANKLIVDSDLLKEAGNNAGGDATLNAWDTIMQKAKAIHEADSSVSVQKAVSQVMVDEPELYEKYLSEKEVV